MNLTTYEELRNHAKRSIEYFQSNENYPKEYFRSNEDESNAKEFWRECKEISKEWLELLNCRDLTLEHIESFTKKLDKLNRKDSSCWLISTTQVIQCWVIRVCPAISINWATRRMIRSGLPLFYRNQDK